MLFFFQGTPYNFEMFMIQSKRVPARIYFGSMNQHLRAGFALREQRRNSSSGSRHGTGDGAVDCFPSRPRRAVESVVPIATGRGDGLRRKSGRSTPWSVVGIHKAILNQLSGEMAEIPFPRSGTAPAHWAFFEQQSFYRRLANCPF